ncbi:MAG TPA: IS630 family transposase [Candidatus Dormibacteraeota bacterium]|nr:IS630 family transposase [Candidatus Dormibacteraeota bacterium]
MNSGYLVSTSGRARVAPRFSPPELVVAVKAIACELPSRLGLPFSRLHVPDIQSEVLTRGLVASISGSTIWRWLDEDAIKPWTHRSWIFPRDPDFEAKAGRVLDLYAREYEGAELKPDEFVISADEKTSIQARIRCHPTVAAAPGRPMRVEHEYERGGSLAYIAAWDVHRAKLFGQLAPTTGIVPFDRLVAEVMSAEPYRSARRVFWVLDNGSSHRGRASVDRLQKAHPNLVPVHLPIHASWLNQIEIYFSILQRKVLTPPDADSLTGLAADILGFQAGYEVMAKPFEWKFTRADLAKLLQRLASKAAAEAPVAA